MQTTDEQKIFHGPFPRPEDFFLQNGAILRYVLRMLNWRLPSVSDGMQNNEKMCNSLGLNP
jgi:hypothetical protein